jgi:hypothetical protein
VDSIDTALDIKTVPTPVILTTGKRKKFVPAAVFLSRHTDGSQTYLFYGARGSVPSNVEIRPNGSIVQPTEAKK